MVRNRPRDPFNPPWYCEWREFADLTDTPEAYDERIILMWVSDHPPTVGDIIARHGRRVLVVTGPANARGRD